MHIALILASQNSGLDDIVFQPGYHQPCAIAESRGRRLRSNITGEPTFSSRIGPVGRPSGGTPSAPRPRIVARYLLHHRPVDWGQLIVTDCQDSTVREKLEVYTFTNSPAGDMRSNSSAEVELWWTYGGRLIGPIIR
jgi:hypothetical protein